jgi:hypothetical protein
LSGIADPDYTCRVSLVAVIERVSFFGPVHLLALTRFFIPGAGYFTFMPLSYEKLLSICW